MYCLDDHVQGQCRTGFFCHLFYKSYPDTRRQVSNLFCVEGYIITAGEFVPPLACSPVTPADNPFSLVLNIKMSLSKTEFGVGIQDTFKESKSATAGISPQTSTLYR